MKYVLEMENPQTGEWIEVAVFSSEQEAQDSLKESTSLVGVKYRIITK